MAVKETKTKFTTLSEKQIAYLSEWAKNFIETNREKLLKEGIAPEAVYTLYHDSTLWPVGVKSFAPMLFLNGIDKVRKRNGYVYILWK